MSSPDPLIVLALDPGAKRAAWATMLVHPNRSRQLGESGVVNRFDLESSGLFDHLDRLLEPISARLLLVTEYPSAGAPCAPQVRQAANVFVARVKARFPRRVRVFKVAPQTWQSRVTKGMPGKDPKARSVTRATLDYPSLGEGFADCHDLADAFNILTFATGFVTWEDAK